MFQYRIRLTAIKKPKKTVNYIESDSEGEDDDEEIFHPSRLHRKSTKRQKTSIGTDDEFKGEADDAFDDEGKSGQVRGVRFISLSLTIML